jgi:DNA-binding CsgD family transcriptional regulator
MAHGGLGAGTDGLAWPQRSTERARVSDCVATGRSVLVVGYAGDGVTAVAEQLADDLGGPQLLFTATGLESLGDLEAFLASARNAPGAVLYAPEYLPRTAADILRLDLAQANRPLVFVTGSSSFERTSPQLDSALDYVRDLWFRDLVTRVDLGDVPDQEIMALVESAVEHDALNDLQIRAVAIAAAGLPKTAIDLVSVDREALLSLPLQAPSASCANMVIPQQAVQRLARRYRSLNREQAQTLHHFFRLSPMPQVSAHMLYGETKIRELMSLRLVRRFDSRGTTYLYVPFIHGASAHQVLDPDFGAIERAMRASVLSLHRAGFPLGDAAMLAGARFRFRGETAYITSSAEAPLQAARLYVERGAGMEAAGTLALLAEQELDPHIRTVSGITSLRASNLLGQHAKSSDEGLTMLREEASGRLRLSTGELMTLVGATSVAHVFSKAEEPWWEDPVLAGYIEERIPGATAVFSVLPLMDPDMVTPHTFCADLEAVAFSASYERSIRLPACVLLILHHLTVGDTSQLERVAEETCKVLTLRDPGPAPDIRQRGVEENWSTLARGVRLTALLLTGVSSPTESLEASVEAYLTGATNAQAGTHWERSYMAACVAATQRLVEGDLQRAALDLQAASQAVRYSAPPCVVTFHRFLGRILELSTQPVTSTHSNDSVLSITCAHLRASTATTEAVEELKRVPAPDKVGPPLLRARLEHLHAMDSSNADALLSAGSALARMHAVGPARQALTQARAMFQSRNASSKVARIDDLLEHTREMKVTAAPVRDSGAEEPVYLTERETDVAALVVEGLTNAKIATRLFISVRTVEPHVMQLRIKLGARRRHDIPARLKALGMGAGD